MTSILTTPFHPAISLAHISEFLAALDSVADCRIYHQQIDYATQQNKRRNLEYYINTFDDDIFISDTVMTKEEVLHDWKLMATIPTAVQKYKSSTGTLFFFANNINTIVEINHIRQSGEDHIWHAFVMYVQHGVVGIYDPSYVEDIETVRLRDIPGIPMALKMLYEIRKARYTVNEVWIGGGGNLENDCMEMSRQWMYMEIVKKSVEELGKWKERDRKQVDL